LYFTKRLFGPSREEHGEVVGVEGKIGLYFSNWRKQIQPRIGHSMVFFLFFSQDGVDMDKKKKLKCGGTEDS
jgi:hypothetical protein